MGEKKFRLNSVLKSLCFHLESKSDQLDNRDIEQSLKSLKKMSFKNPELIQTLCHNFNVDDPTLTLPILKSVLISLSRLNFLDMEFLDGISNWMNHRIDGLSDADLASFVMTCAVLNYVPKHSEIIFKVIYVYKQFLINYY